MAKQNGRPVGNKPTEKEIVVRVIAGILGFLMVFSVLVIVIQAYAKSAVDLKSGEEVSVALFDENSLTESFTASASKGFHIEIPSDEGYVSFDDASVIKTLSIANGENLVKSGSAYTTAPENTNAAVGGYRVMLSSYSTKIGGSSKNDNIVQFRPSTETTGTFSKDNIRGYINRISETVQRLGGYPIPAYIGGDYYICLGGFTTKESAESFLDSFKTYYNCQSLIKEPDKNAISLIDYQTGTLILHLSGVKSLALTPIDSESFTAGSGEEYYGRFTLNKDKNGFEVINSLYIEQYVASRLALEVDTSWNTEALKAVSTVVRTNAYSRLGESSVHSASGFDFCADDHCGKYRGCGSVNENVENAVNATKNMVIKSEGRLINALYGSTYGGATVSLSDAYGSLMAGKGGYLVGTLTPWEDFEKRSGGRWKSEISSWELYEILSQRVSDCKLRGDVAEIKVTKRSEDGIYVTEIEFTDIFDNKQTLSGSEVIRNLLSGTLKSANFVVGVSGSETTEVTPKYDQKTKEITLTETKVTFDGTYGNFVFVGRGSGSGLGMSLNGVNDLANKGYSYENAYIDIISIYYKDVTVETVVPPDEDNANEGLDSEI